MNGEERKTYRLLVENPEEKRRLRKPRLRSVNDIKMDL
jgi:hypothetical protein